MDDRCQCRLEMCDEIEPDCKCLVQKMAEVMAAYHSWVIRDEVDSEQIQSHITHTP